MAKLTDPEGMQAYITQVADHRGWEVNPDRDLVDPIVAGLRKQTERWGKPFCPCRDVNGDAADKDIVCPCVYAQADIDESGQCFCGLFLAPGKDPQTVGSIPERRPEQ